MRRRCVLLKPTMQNPCLRSSVEHTPGSLNSHIHLWKLWKSSRQASGEAKLLGSSCPATPLHAGFEVRAVVSLRAIARLED